MTDSGRGRRSALAAVGLVLSVCSAQGQTGGGYDLRRNSVDGGGATFSTGGSYQLGGTIGQPDAGALSAGAYALGGGFWAGVLPPPTATPTGTPTTTQTQTPPSTPTVTRTFIATLAPTATATAVAPPIGTATHSATATPTPSATGVATTTATVTPTAGGPPTPTSTPITCLGDCGADEEVSVNELITMVNIALGNAPLTACEAGDRDGNMEISIDELLAAVSNALNGCE